MGRIETVSDLIAFVGEKESHIDLSNLHNPRVLTVGCGDPLLDHYADWLLVGGVAYLYQKGHLTTFVSARRGKGGILEGHLACGWMFVNGFTSYESQRGLMVEVRQEVQYLNSQFNTSFVVPEPGHIGSAAPFMSGR